MSGLACCRVLGKDWQVFEIARTGVCDVPNSRALRFCAGAVVYGPTSAPVLRITLRRDTIPQRDRASAHVHAMPDKAAAALAKRAQNEHRRCRLEVSDANATHGTFRRTGMPTPTETQIPEPKRAASEKTVGRLFFLDASVGGRIVSVNADGSDRKVIVNGCRIPDGIVVDLEAGHIYWTNMGVPSENDGSIERADLDGQNRRTIIANGDTFTPKQLHLEKVAGKLYWCDREGMRVMRCNLDGSNIETLVDPSGGEARPGRDATKWCVGIAVDPHRRQIYWTQKGPDDAGKGRIFRANIDIPKGENAANRSDIELLFDGLPEPIDLELDLKKRLIYWTDRGDPPRGNTVNRAAMDSESGKRPPPEILLTHLMEGIGIALDFKGSRMFITDLSGSIYRAELDGADKKVLLAAQGNLTGIAYVDINKKENRHVIQ
jgi:Low-density lipoprotein receptor repeat class B